MRLVGTVCSLVMLCLSALGAGAVQRALPGAARGAAELALHGAVDSPLLMSRGAVPASSVQRIAAERHVPPGMERGFVPVAIPRGRASAMVSVALANQAGA